MKKLNFTLSILLLLLAIGLMAQVNAPKWLTDKCSSMKEQIKTDLQLTNEEAESFYQIILEKSITDGAEVKKLTTDDEKKAYYKESYQKTVIKYKTAFGEEKGMAIQKWVSANQVKFNKPKN